MSGRHLFNFIFLSAPNCVFSFHSPKSAFQRGLTSGSPQGGGRTKAGSAARCGPGAGLRGRARGGPAGPGRCSGAPCCPGPVPRGAPRGPSPPWGLRGPAGAGRDPAGPGWPWGSEEGTSRSGGAGSRLRRPTIPALLPGTEPASSARPAAPGRMGPEPEPHGVTGAVYIVMCNHKRGAAPAGQKRGFDPSDADTLDSDNTYSFGAGTGAEQRGSPFNPIPLSQGKDPGAAPHPGHRSAPSLTSQGLRKPRLLL